MRKRNIIVIGASAGGFGPLRTIVAGLPASLDAYVLIVRHMSPDVTGVLPQTLGKTSLLPVANAVDGAPMRPGHILVSPPDRHLLIEGTTVRTTRGPKENRFRPAIDPLFRSAASEYGARVIGVILSGALDDGASGLWAIKQAGGIAIVQDPADAEVPSMPSAAMEAAAVDYCVPADRIADLLVRLSQETVPDGPPAPIPPRIPAEVAIASEQANAALLLFQTAPLTPYTCPECNGVLARFREGDRTRFRCHTGHAYTFDALLGGISQRVEEGYYNAIRAVEESIFALNHFGDHFAEVNEPGLAAVYFRKAKEAEQQIGWLRLAFRSHEYLTTEKLAAEAAKPFEA